MRWSAASIATGIGPFRGECDAGHVPGECLATRRVAGLWRGRGC